MISEAERLKYFRWDKRDCTWFMVTMCGRPNLFLMKISLGLDENLYKLVLMIAHIML